MLSVIEVQKKSIQHKHDLSLDLLGILVKHEGLFAVLEGISAEDEAVVKLQSSVGEAVGGQLPFLARERGGIAHPGTGQIEFLAVQVLPHAGREGHVAAGRTDAADVGTVARQLEGHLEGDGVAGGFIDAAEARAAGVGHRF